MTDPERVGGIAWLERTRGSLSSAERRRLVPAILRGQALAIAGRLAVWAGRQPDATEIPTPPDSALARDAEEAAAEQPSAIVGHSYRTWAFGRALAAFDEAAGASLDLDEELFYVAALLHDAGLVETVTGEDFTLRSAAAAASLVGSRRDACAVDHVRDAIGAHTTPGASVEVDGAVAVYVQAGATCDLGGLRLQHLAADFVRNVAVAHPRTAFVDDITRRISAEADAVPDGRFALLRRTGFVQAVRWAPLPS
ncbi:MAG: HD domain-containing protein [Actinomycetota bacterium]